MNKASFQKRFLFPALTILFGACIGFFGYFTVRSQGITWAASVLGLVYFICVARLILRRRGGQRSPGLFF